MKTCFFPITLAVLLALAASCSKQSETQRGQNPFSFSGVDATKLVARVGAQPIEYATLRHALSRRGPGADKEALLDELVTFEAAYARGRAAGHDFAPAQAVAFLQSYPFLSAPDLWRQP